MNKTILVTKTVGNSQYQLYRTKVVYSATVNNYRGISVQQEVKISGYGIVVIMYIGQEEIYYDSHPLSPVNYAVSALYHHLVRQDFNDLQQIRAAIWKEYETWRLYEDPFEKIANQTLRNQIRQLVH